MTKWKNAQNSITMGYNRYLLTIYLGWWPLHIREYLSVRGHTWQQVTFKGEHVRVAWRTTKQFARVSDSVIMGPVICISNKCPEDTDVDGL